MFRAFKLPPVSFLITAFFQLIQDLVIVSVLHAVHKAGDLILAFIKRILDRIGENPFLVLPGSIIMLFAGNGKSDCNTDRILTGDYGGKTLEAFRGCSQICIVISVELGVRLFAVGCVKAALSHCRRFNIGVPGSVLRCASSCQSTVFRLQCKGCILIRMKFI